MSIRNYYMKGKYWYVALFCLCTFFACRHEKKISLSGEEPVNIHDFIKSFQPLEVPYQVADTSVSKKRNDTTLISYKVFTNLVPDSVLTKLFNSEKPRIYPLGRLSAPNEETYLFVKALTSQEKAVIMLCFDKKNNFVAGMPVLIPDANPATEQTSVLDKRYTISKNITRKNADGSISEGKNVYVLNEPAKSFLLIMTDALDAQSLELINPIESLPKKNKYSGDYSKDKKNIVSIRDNKRQGRITFFVHFERKNNCTGELKGEASFTSGSTAVYRSDVDFCVLQFTFTPSSVSVLEKEGCGSHRGVECTFDGTFFKKKETKKKEASKKLNK